MTQQHIDRLKVGSWVPRTDAQVIERIRTLASTHTVTGIAERLNEDGLRSALGRAFREHHILYLARRHNITVTTCAERLPSAVH